MKTEAAEGSTKSGAQGVALGDRAKALAAVLRVKPESMEAHELDLAAALLLGIAVEIRDGSPVLVGDDGQPKSFEPSTNWEDYGRLVSDIELVVASHAMYDDQEQPEKVTGHWYSAHSYFSGTNTEGFDLRGTVLITVAKRLAHQVKYPPGR